MSEQTEYNLEASAINTYTNTILWYMKEYQLAARYRNNFNATIMALKTLLDAMPPKAQLFLETEITTIRNYEVNTELLKDWTDLDLIFRKAMGWLWPNLLEFHFNTAKPAYTAAAHLGNKGR